MTIRLAMIVRDNAEILPRCLRSARDHIDSYTIIDTGSTDDTIQVVRTELDGLPGKILERPWVNAGHNRTELLELARGTADYLLLLDADHELVVTGELPALTAPAYSLIEKESGWAWRMPRLIDDSREWKYSGTVHEALDGAHDAEPLDAWSVIHHGDGRTPTVKRQRAKEELLAALEADPDDARSVFYLARTHQDLGEWSEAIEMFRRRIEMPGWDEETFYAQYSLGCLLCEHVSYSDGADYLLDAWAARPHRAEPLRALAFAASAVADGLPWPDDRLFVHSSAYLSAEASTLPTG